MATILASGSVNVLGGIACDSGAWLERQKVMTGIAGKVVHSNGLVALVFKVKGKLYAHTEENGEIIDTYLHTGDESVLDQLSNEVPF